MSPHSNQRHITSYCFPRVSGDEPGEVINVTRNTKFSPRERG